MGGILLDQPLPHRGLDQIDPFVLLHHWDHTYPGGQRQQDLGVGPHPHRGFAPVTFIFNGAVKHQDSEGHISVVEAGGTQWMNSGSGIVHSERPANDLAKKGGRFEIIQFWVNAPAKNKMDKPSYQPLSKEDTPVVKSKDGKMDVGVVVGAFNEKKGKIKPYSDMLGLRIDGRKGGKMDFPIPANFNAFLYVLNGEVLVNGEKSVDDKDMVHFANDGAGIQLEMQTDARAILLAGAPINEPIATYGPFVMNSQQEIIQAMHDFQNGKMGQLIESFD